MKALVDDGSMIAIRSKINRRLYDKEQDDGAIDGTAGRSIDLLLLTRILLQLLSSTLIFKSMAAYIIMVTQWLVAQLFLLLLLMGLVLLSYR